MFMDRRIKRNTYNTSSYFEKIDNFDINKMPKCA